ncbi:MAG: hypothetical protein M1169_05905 [Firmicutes bacterium]|nr:hypothetical protein [Bacillota bacterium]
MGRRFFWVMVLMGVSFFTLLLKPSLACNPGLEPSYCYNLLTYPSTVSVGQIFTITGTIEDIIPIVSVNIYVTVGGGPVATGCWFPLLNASGPGNLSVFDNVQAAFTPTSTYYFPPGSTFSATFVVPSCAAGESGSFVGFAAAEIGGSPGGAAFYGLTITSEEEKLNISAAPTALRPSYFNTNNTTSTISVTVTDAQGNPLTKPQLLKFKIFVPSIPSPPTQEGIALVGGHVHLYDSTVGNRPLGLFETTQGETPLSHFSCGTVFPQPLNFKGYEYKSLQGDSSDSCEFEGETNSQGDLTLTYFSPPVGGQVNLKVTPVNQTLASGSQNQAQILMRVPGLELLPDDSLLYTKTGGTYDHPGPCPPQSIRMFPLNAIPKPIM